MRCVLTLLVLGMAVAGCARRVEPPSEAAVYPGQPVRVVAGTNYAAYPGLPTPPANQEGVVPPPPPRYMGESTSASSANVAQSEVRRDVRACLRSAPVLDVADCEQGE